MPCSGDIMLLLSALVRDEEGRGWVGSVHHDDNDGDSRVAHFSRGPNNQTPTLMLAYQFATFSSIFLCHFCCRRVVLLVFSFGLLVPQIVILSLATTSRYCAQPLFELLVACIVFTFCMIGTKMHPNTPVFANANSTCTFVPSLWFRHEYIF